MTQLVALKDYRKARGITQAQLAIELGISTNTIWRWESGERRVDRELLPDVSAKTGIPKRILRPDLAELLVEDAAQ